MLIIQTCSEKEPVLCVAQLVDAPENVCFDKSRLCFKWPVGKTFTFWTILDSRITKSNLDLTYTTSHIQ